MFGRDAGSYDNMIWKRKICHFIHVVEGARNDYTTLSVPDDFHDDNYHELLLKVHGQL